MHFLLIIAVAVVTFGFVLPFVACCVFGGLPMGVAMVRFIYS